MKRLTFFFLSFEERERERERRLTENREREREKEIGIFGWCKCKVDDIHDPGNQIHNHAVFSLARSCLNIFSTGSLLCMIINFSHCTLLDLCFVGDLL